MEKNLIVAPDYIVKSLSEEYSEYITKVQFEFAKDPEAYLNKMMKDHEGNSPVFKAMPNPIRLKAFGYLPLHFELGVMHDEKAIMTLMDLLSHDDLALSEITDALVRVSSAFREHVQRIGASAMDTNLGALNTAIFPHRYFARGEKYFEITPALIDMLEMTDLGDKTPSGFLRAPYEMQYIHCPASFQIHNPVSGWHDLEGFYINQYHIKQEDIEEEYKRLKQLKRTNLLTSFVEDGSLNFDSGDLRLLEIMAYGKPKASNMDDASYNFTILIHDEMQSVGDLIESHKKYFMGKPKEDSPLFEFKVMDDRNYGQFKNVMEMVTKLLLYINSDKAERREMKGASELQEKIDNTPNKVKKRKLTKQKSKLVDKIIIGSDSYDFGQHSGTSTGRSMKTHWRRGHFAKRRHGAGRKEIKVVWLQPSLIGAGQLSAGVNYEVK